MHAMANRMQKPIATSLSRRYVAMTVLIPFVFLVLGSALFKAIGVFVEFDPPRDDAISELAKHWADLAVDNFGFAVVSVIIFYYGPHAIGAVGALIGGKRK